MLPDNRLKFQAPLIQFDTQVGTTGMQHDDFPAPRTQARYDQLRMYLIALLSNQSSFVQPTEYRLGSLWFNLNTNTLQVNNNVGWQDISNAIELDANLTLQQWYTAVKTVLTGNPNDPDPFSQAVFTTRTYDDPAWLTGLSTSKLVGTINANKLTGTLSPSLFPQLTIGTDIGSAEPGSVLFVNASGFLSQDANVFTYSSIYQALQINTNVNTQSVQINQTSAGSDAGIALQLSQATTTILGTAGRTNAGIIGTVIGDTYLIADGSVLISTNSGSYPALHIDSNSIVNIGSAQGDTQLVVNQTSTTYAAITTLQRGGVFYSNFGLAGDPTAGHSILEDANLNDFVFQNRAGSFLFAAGGTSAHLAITPAGIAVNGTISSVAGLTCTTIAASGAVNCGAITTSTINASGTIVCTGLTLSSGTLTGSGSGLTGIPQSGIINLATTLDTKANDNAVIHLTGAESMSGGKTITTVNTGVVPLTLLGVTSQTANLLEARDSSNNLKASIDPTGKFTGDGSGLANISISIGTLSGTLPIANGGTNATTAAAARTSLGLAIGTNVQAHSTALDGLAAITPALGTLFVATATGWTNFAVGANTALLVADSTQASGLRWTTTLSSPGVGTSSEHFGASAAAAGASATAFGNNASATGAASVAMGATASAASNAIAIGSSVTANATSVVVGVNASGVANSVSLGEAANALGQYGVTIGNSATCNNAHDIVIGDSAISTANATGPALLIGHGTSGTGNSTVLGHGASAGNLGGIALGIGAATTAASQCVLGSSTAAISNIFLGGGVTNASATPITINATGGSGTDHAGSNLTLAGGISTGAGNSGAIVFQYSPSGSSSSSPNTLTNCGQFNSNGVFNALCGAVVTPSTVTPVPLTVKGAASQSADLQEWQSNSGTVLAKITNAGGLQVNSLALSSSTVTTLLGLTLTTATGTVYGVTNTVTGTSTNNYGESITVAGGTAGNTGVATTVTAAGSSTNYGFIGTVLGTTSGNNIGILVTASGGAINQGVNGTATGIGNSSNIGITGTAIASNSGNNYGVYGIAYGGTSNFAGLFSGRLGIQVNASEPDHLVLQVMDASSNILAGVDRFGNPSGGLHLGGLAEGRLTLSSTDSFPSASGGGITGSTLYYLPHVGDRLTIINASTLLPETLVIPTGLSVSLTGCAANTNYDVFATNNGDSTMSLDLVAWADSSTGGGSRATNATLVQGSTGTLSRLNYPSWRYLGTIRCYATSTCADTPAMSFVWNYNNRHQKRLTLQITTASWTNNINCYAPMNVANTTAIQHVQLLIGYQDGVIADFTACLSASAATAGAMVGIALNPVLTGGLCGSWISNADLNGRLGTGVGTIQARLTQHLVAGYHYLTAMEGTLNSGASTFVSGNAPQGIVSGIVGYYTG